MTWSLLSLFEGVGAVQRVALRGDEARVGDNAPQLAFVGAVAHAGGVHHVFFDQDAAHVVRAELQSYLADFDSGREPARLDVVDVVEIQPADRQRLQVIDRRGFLDFLTQRGIFRRENPRDERGEASGIFLDAPDTLEVIHAVAQLFAATEHHRGRGAQAQLVRDAVHVFPVVAAALEPRDLAANFVVQDFRAASGNRGEARIHQPPNGVFDGQVADFRDAQNFRRGE